MSESRSEEELVRTKVGALPPLKRCSYDVGFAHTSPLVEIFQVRIDKFDAMERPGELYGKIEVVNLAGPVTLYHRDRGNPEHVRANCTISLAGPPCSIALIIGFGVNVDLRLRRNWDQSDVEDVVLSKWELSWDALKPQVAYITRGKFFEEFCNQYDVLSSQTDCKYQLAGYDQPLSAVFEGPNGCCLTMYYALLKNAVEAIVEVEVIDINGVPTMVEYNVHGSILASYGHFERGNDSSIKDYCKTELLKTKELETVKAERWKKIPLSRQTVAVPAYTSLIIEADLWDSSHHKIANGKLEFTPYHRNFVVDYIKGDDDTALRVIVRWMYGSRIPENELF